MNLEHIQEMLLTMCSFNTSSITTTFSYDNEDTVVVSCLTGTLIIEVTFLKDQQSKQYTSIDEAALAIYKNISADTPS